MWMYVITKCDHAGLFKFNSRLCEFQTGIKSSETVIKELGNRLVRVSEELIFCPKFITFQYPDFPKSSVKQQDSALKLLQKAGLWDGKKITLTKELANSYGNESDNGSDSVLPPIKFSEDYFESKELCFAAFRDDDLFMDECLMTLSGRGWKAVKAIDVLGLVKNFLVSKADLNDTKKEVKRHFKNWISSSNTKVENLITLSEIFKTSLNGTTRQPA